MKRARVRIGVSLCILLLIAVGIPASAQTRPVVLELTTVDDFDSDQGQQWAAYGSKFSNPEFPQTAYVNSFPEALYGRYSDETDDLRALGVHMKWDRKGYNYVEIVPVAPGADGALVAAPIPIRGKASRIDMWVWGGNFNYYAEVHLMDYRGVPHSVFLGDLTFSGWRNLSVEIPKTIPQAVKWIPQERPLTITKFVVWTRPDERVDDYYIYFDELKILTDVAENRFDGDRLAQPEFLEQAWSDARRVEP
jgi:hypothetical protein